MLNSVETSFIGDLINMCIVYYSFIDPIYISQAEDELKKALSDYKINYKKHEEIIVVSKNVYKLVQTLYQKIAMEYSGHTQIFINEKNELTTKIKEFENKIIHMDELFKEKEKNHQTQLENKDILLQNKDMQSQNRDL